MRKELVIFYFLFSVTGVASAQSIHLCAGDTAQSFWVEPSNPLNDFQWSFIAGVGAEIVSGQNTPNAFIDFPVEGNYMLRLEESALIDCENSVLLEVVVHPLPIPSFAYDSLCEGEPVQFVNTTVSDVVNSYWNLEGEKHFDHSLMHTFQQAGNYPLSLTVVDAQGCSNTLTEWILVKESPVADFYVNPSPLSTLEPEAVFVNLSNDFMDAHWDFGDGNTSEDWMPIHSYQQAGWHEVILSITDEDGCNDSHQKAVLIENELITYFPNAFTPDGDFLNDTYGVEGHRLEYLKEYHLKVYNRWGDIIFESRAVNKRWDGYLSSGVESPAGIYTWSARFVDELGKETKQYGHLTLTR